jgi:hypothetical protein
MSTAATLAGPWSAQACFFTPPEKDMPDVLLYAGKSHPMLRGPDMAFTYVVNTLKEDRLLKDMSIYFPIMLKGRVIGDDSRLAGAETEKRVIIKDESLNNLRR